MHSNAIESSFPDIVAPIPITYMMLNLGKRVSESKRQVSDFKLKYKTELCRNWENGFCLHDTNCAFAHGTSELKAKSHIPLNYKTKKCSQFFQLGFCSYGSRCQFSHEQSTAPGTPQNTRKSTSDGKRLPIFVELENREA